MVTIPEKVKERLIAGVKKYQPILAKARDKDINESDTVTIISDILSDVFGYDKYSEITSEYAIKKTFCDLAIKLDGSPRLLIEAKAAGLDLKDQHIRQAVDYGSNSGVEWVVLTSGIIWKVYKILFSKPVVSELIYEFDMSTVNPKRASDVELLYMLTKEAMTKSSKTSLEEFVTYKQFFNRFTVGQILVTDPVLDAIRRTLKKVAPDAKISNDEIRQMLADEIIKREIFDGDKAVDAKKKVGKALKPIASKPSRKEVTPSETIQQ